VCRSALGNSSLPLGWKLSSSASTQRINESPGPSRVTAYFPEIGQSSENARMFRQCPSQSSIKDSCSSATGGSSTYFSHKPSLSNPEIPSSFFKKESICSNFLTLGISTSSSSPDRTGWNEPEESIQDNTPTSMNDVSRLRLQETTTSGCDGDNAIQVRKPTYMQVSILVAPRSTRSVSWLKLVVLEFNLMG
jgi:hypothetical protein